MEIWKDIPGYENEYEASSEGRIRTKAGKTTWSTRWETERVWKQRVLKQKWFSSQPGRKDARVSLWKNGAEKTALVARCVCMAFYPIENASELTVNHIDGDPANNSAGNLEWLTRGDNIRAGFEMGLYSSVTKPVNLFIGEAKIQFNSYSKCAAFLGRNHGYIGEKIKKGFSQVTDAKGRIYRIEVIS